MIIDDIYNILNERRRGRMPFAPTKGRFGTCPYGGKKKETDDKRDACPTDFFGSKIFVPYIRNWADVGVCPYEISV
jgi:hypothetical protein